MLRKLLFTIAGAFGLQPPFEGPNERERNELDRLQFQLEYAHKTALENDTKKRARIAAELAAFDARGGREAWAVYADKIRETPRPPRINWLQVEVERVNRTEEGAAA